MKTLKNLLLLILVSTAAAAAAPKERITIKGSDTLVILVQKWTEIYGAQYDIEFQVTGGGSGTGIAALINGTTDICSSSRPMKPNEVRQLREKVGYRGMEVRVARDGLSVYVNDKNRIQHLTIEQLSKIFTGVIKNWKEVGGADAPIILYSRENSSGTYEFFKEHVLNKQDFDARAQHMAGTAALVNAIAKDPNGIGYGGAAYLTGVKAIGVGTDPKGPFVEPVEETILNGTYPISRFLYFYLGSRPQGKIKDFIDWVISPAGQKVVNDVGYYPLKKD
jgi:phosphate transport system substrate-binding protein